MQQAIKTLVPEEVYTDRQEFINYFYEYALKAITRRAMSTVLLGKRRMGKTEIFKRVVNRLFFEQDHTDPKAAVPVYYSFQDVKLDSLNVALEYVENFLRWYAAFRLRDINLLSNLPHYDFRIVGFFQEAVESPTCPHFVTGSAMTILSKEILGRGALFGRFDSDPIEPLTEYWGAELARRAAVHYKTKLVDMMAPVVSHRCGGNPFYITAVIRQAAKQQVTIDSEATVNNLLAVDLSSGFIWAELNDQVTRWIQRMNEYGPSTTLRIGITKWVLYLSALEEGERIEPEHIQQQLAEKEGTHVNLDTIRDVLIWLSHGDLLEYMELGGWFRKVDDPILLDFLKAWGRFEVEGHRKAKIVTDTIRQYDLLKRLIHDQRGYLVEVYLSQILWNGQRKTFPGRYFHSITDVSFPRRFYDIRHRLRLAVSAESEVDVYASTGTEIWLCESKWWETQKVGADVVRHFLDLVEKLKDFEGREYFEGERPVTLHLWLFAHNGVTLEAEVLLKEHQMYWSTRPDLDALIKEVGLRPLPTFSD